MTTAEMVKIKLLVAAPVICTVGLLKVIDVGASPENAYYFGVPIFCILMFVFIDHFPSALALKANVPRSVLVHRASFFFSAISRMIAA